MTNYLNPVCRYYVFEDENVSEHLIYLPYVMQIVVDHMKDVHTSLILYASK